MKKVIVCPICKKRFYGYPAISRKDNQTEICADCAVEEALEDFLKYRAQMDAESSK